MKYVAASGKFVYLSKMSHGSNKRGEHLGRPASGSEVLISAKALMRRVRSAVELRQAQAVVLPLELVLVINVVMGGG